jgi:hypothetical protein
LLAEAAVAITIVTPLRADPIFVCLNERDFVV